MAPRGAADCRTERRRLGTPGGAAPDPKAQRSPPGLVWHGADTSGRTPAAAQRRHDQRGDAPGAAPAATPRGYGWSAAWRVCRQTVESRPVLLVPVRRFLRAHHRRAPPAAELRVDPKAGLYEPLVCGTRDLALVRDVSHEEPPFESAYSRGMTQIGSVRSQPTDGTDGPPHSPCFSNLDTHMAPPYADSQPALAVWSPRAGAGGGWGGRVEVVLVPPGEFSPRDVPGALGLLVVVPDLVEVDCAAV